MAIQRGIRNNNPGNIDYNAINKWQGALPHDPSIEKRFCRFESPECGIRAIMILLRTYQQKYGLKTISDLINRWAPNNENNTSAYIINVSNSMNLSPKSVVNIKDKATLISLVKAIIFYENGQQPYNDAIFDKAYNII
ncbi:MAG TPA: structural protein [Arsenophonus nasoniae]|uniref:structural protein n=1 Tax=Arsenophonus nasoniae TaxID=638 RepID=UPI00387A3AB7